VLEYRYDDARRTAELINENGDAHRFVFDPLDRMPEETTFDARLRRYSYDGSGLLVGKEELGCAPRTEYTAMICVTSSFDQQRRCVTKGLFFIGKTFGKVKVISL